MNEVSPTFTFEESFSGEGENDWLPMHHIPCERVGSVEDGGKWGLQEPSPSIFVSHQPRQFCNGTPTTTPPCTIHPIETGCHVQTNAQSRSNRTVPSYVSFPFSSVNKVESTCPKRIQTPVRNETRHCPSITCHGCVSIDRSSCRTKRRNRATRRAGSFA